MNWKDWLRTLLGVSILLGIGEMLLPPGGMAKFSKFVLGLALMFAILQPISNLLILNPAAANLDWPGQTGPEPEIGTAAARVQLAGVKSVLQAEDGSLARQIEQLLLVEAALAEARIEAARFGRAAALVQIEPYNHELHCKVQGIVSGILKVQPEQIDVERLGQ